MLVAITGTPGTGKTGASAVIERRGYAVIHLDDLARREGCVVGRDDVRGTDEVDLDLLRTKLHVPAKLAFLHSHYSHLMPVNVAAVLRCRPSVLRQRLETRGWPSAKVRENVEAEAIGVITQQAASRVPFVYEIDTTDGEPEGTADRILAILRGDTHGHDLGSVDWSDEVLSWY
ncbi:MAG: adenylate kinase family protein [Methanobacteriota archaeon]